MEMEIKWDHGWLPPARLGKRVFICRVWINRDKYTTSRVSRKWGERGRKGRNVEVLQKKNLCGDVGKSVRCPGLRH